MGGKALGFESMRLEASEYFALTSNLKHAFSLGWSGAIEPPVIDLIPAYANKESFGDADFIFSGRAGDWEKFIKNVGDFVPEFTGDVNQNGSVFSVGVQLPTGIFQVDFIYAGANAESARIMKVYFSYNDLGNLMGRIAHRTGLRWGQDGLSYVLRSPENKDRVLGEYNLTRATSLETSFSLMGYEWQRWRQGFNRLEDVFEYVASSRYFSPEIFLLHNRNAISRARDAKRKTYSDFLEWVAENGDSMPSFDLREDERDHFKSGVFHSLCNFYPDFAKWYHDVMYAHYLRERASGRFNGKTVSEMTGLQGRELGAFMATVRERIQAASLVDSFAPDDCPGGTKIPDVGLNNWILRNDDTLAMIVQKLKQEKL